MENENRDGLYPRSKVILSFFDALLNEAKIRSASLNLAKRLESAAEDVRFLSNVAGYMQMPTQEEYKRAISGYKSARVDRRALQTPSLAFSEPDYQGDQIVFTVSLGNPYAEK